MHSHFSSITWTCCSGWIVDTTGYLVEVMEGSTGKYLRRITAILPLSTANKQLPLYVWVSYATLGSLHTKRHNLQLVKLETCCDLQHINYSMGLNTWCHSISVTFKSHSISVTFKFCAVRIALCALEPCSTDSLGTQHQNLKVTLIEWHQVFMPDILQGSKLKLFS